MGDKGERIEFGDAAVEIAADKMQRIHQERVNSAAVDMLYQRDLDEVNTARVLQEEKKKLDAEVAERLEAGSVWINQHPVVTATIPFGGVKQSGVGVEGSILGLKAYTNPLVLNIKR